MSLLTFSLFLIIIFVPLCLVLSLLSQPYPFFIYISFYPHLLFHFFFHLFIPISSFPFILHLSRLSASIFVKLGFSSIISPHILLPSLPLSCISCFFLYDLCGFFYSAVTYLRVFLRLHFSFPLTCFLPFIFFFFAFLPLCLLFSVISVPLLFSLLSDFFFFFSTFCCLSPYSFLLIQLDFLPFVLFPLSSNHPLSFFFSLFSAFLYRSVIYILLFNIHPCFLFFEFHISFFFFLFRQPLVLFLSLTVFFITFYLHSFVFILFLSFYRVFFLNFFFFHLPTNRFLPFSCYLSFFFFYAFYLFIAIRLVFSFYRVFFPSFFSIIAQQLFPVLFSALYSSFFFPLRGFFHLNVS